MNIKKSNKATAINMLDRRSGRNFPKMKKFN